MSNSGQIADVVRLGILPRQHHDRDWGIGSRIVTYSARVKRNTKHSPMAEEIIDTGIGLADDLGGLFWGPAGGKRPCSAWASIFSVIKTGAKTSGQHVPRCNEKGKRQRTRVRRPKGKAKKDAWAPAKAVDEPDLSFVEKTLANPPKWHSQFPADWTGLMACGTDHLSQEEIFHPDFLGLVAVNDQGNVEHGTRVFDTDKDGKVNQGRWRELQSLVSVLDLTPGGCGISGKALALQLGSGGRLDSGKPGYGLMVHQDTCRVGVLSQIDGSGPFIIDTQKAPPPKPVRFNDGLNPPQVQARGRCKHVIGKDADGRTIHPVHLSTNSLFLAPGGKDSPLYFRNTAWIKPELDGPHPMQVYLRWRHDEKHTWCGGDAPGKWDWQKTSFFYVPEPSS